MASGCLGVNIGARGFRVRLGLIPDVIVKLLRELLLRRGIDVFCAGVDEEKGSLSGKNGGAWGLSEFLLIGDTGVWLRQSKTFIAGV